MADEQEAANTKYVPSLTPDFGDTRGFWNRYEELAGTSDQQLSSNLNSNLDNLLIFAGLFSAINTTFISFTMPSLSPDSLDKTNALLELVLQQTDNGALIRTSPSPPFSPSATIVVANCLLYASLCCSLLAAAGAMLGKEWLRNFDQKGEVASPGDQARLRQKKFRAVQRWRFRESIQGLPYILFLSLVLFFAGLIPYIFAINRTVAWVVIGCLACGGLGWACTIRSCIKDPHSPYQSIFTSFIHNYSEKEERQGGEPRGGIPDQGKASPDLEQGNSNVGARNPSSSALSPKRETIGNHNVIVPSDSRRSHNGNGLSPADPAGDPLHPPPRGAQSHSSTDWEEKHGLNAETVRWFLRITSKPEDLRIMAQNLCCLEFQARSVILNDSASWQRILHFARDALKRWKDRPEPETRLTAELLGAALGHLLIDKRRDNMKWQEVHLRFEEKLFQSTDPMLMTGSAEPLTVLKSVLVANHVTIWQKDVEQAEYDLRKVLLQRQIFERRNGQWSVLVAAIREPYDDVILNLLAVLISTRSDPPESPSDSHSQELAIAAYRGLNLVQHLSKALAAHSKIFEKTNETNQRDSLAEIYIALLQKIRGYCRSNSDETDPHSLDEIRRQLPGFIRGLIERPEVEKSCNLNWARFVMKAVDTITASAIDEPSRDAIYDALSFLVARSQARSPEIDSYELAQFTHDTFKAIAQALPSFPAKSLGNISEIVPHLVSVVEGVDQAKWLSYFADYPSIWMPDDSEAITCWKDTSFIRILLQSFNTAGNPKEQEELSSIMAHIADSPSDWCTELILTSDGLAEVVDKYSDPNNSAGTRVVIALRPFLKVYPRDQIDWGTDLMQSITKKLSTSIVKKDSELLQRLKAQDSGVNIQTLADFIKRVRDSRKYDESSLAKINQAIDYLDPPQQSNNT